MLEYYERQTEEEAATEHAAALRGQTLMAVPHELVPVVRQIIAEHERGRRVDK